MAESYSIAHMYHISFIQVSVNEHFTASVSRLLFVKYPFLSLVMGFVVDSFIHSFGCSFLPACRMHLYSARWRGHRASLELPLPVQGLQPRGRTDKAQTGTSTTPTSTCIHVSVYVNVTHMGVRKQAVANTQVRSSPRRF